MILFAFSASQDLRCASAILWCASGLRTQFILLATPPSPSKREVCVEMREDKTMAQAGGQEASNSETDTKHKHAPVISTLDRQETLKTR